MRKWIAPVIVSVIALLLSLRLATVAQGTLNAPGPSSEDMERKALGFLSALQTMAPDTLFEQLAQWRRNEVELYWHRIQNRVRDGKLTWPKIERTVTGKSGLDPMGKLGLSSLEDYKSLTPPKMLGLYMGLYRLQADPAAAAALNDKWFAIDRSVGLMEPRDRQRNRNRPLIQQGGAVFFESILGSTMDVRCAADSRDWFIIDVECALNKVVLSLSSAVGDMSSAAGKRGEPEPDSHFDGPAGEGEMHLGSMKSQARVAFAKMGTAPSQLTGAMNATAKGCNVNATELEGKYYKVRDKVESNDTRGILIADPIDSADGWLLLVFNWAGGEGEIRHYESKGELETALTELKANNFKFRDDDSREAAPKPEPERPRPAGNEPG